MLLQLISDIKDKDIRKNRISVKDMRFLVSIVKINANFFGYKKRQI